MEWIKFRDKMPDDEQECWCFLKEKYHEELVIRCTYFKDEYGVIENWFESVIGDQFSIDEFTHWMPYYTPEPPKDE